jgi:hypothetical protein
MMGRSERPDGDVRTIDVEAEGIWRPYETEELIKPLHRFLNTKRTTNVDFRVHNDCEPVIGRYLELVRTVYPDGRRWGTLQKIRLLKRAEHSWSVSLLEPDKYDRHCDVDLSDFVSLSYRGASAAW